MKMGEKFSEIWIEFSCDLGNLSVNINVEYLLDIDFEIYSILFKFVIFVKLIDD